MTVPNSTQKNLSRVEIPSVLNRPGPCTQRVLKTATCHLMDFYKTINAKYYADRADKDSVAYEEKLAAYGVGEAVATGVYGRVVTAKDDPSKVLKLQSPRRQRHCQSFVRAAKIETAALKQLQGEPHIPKMLDAFSHPGQRYAIVMENAGPNLYQTYLDIRNPDRKNASLDEIATIGKKLLEGLTAIHKSGRAHLDLKPENCTSELVLDFGSVETSLPVEGGLIKVSHFYRPPEVVWGLPFDTKVDMWSLACVLFELDHKTPLFPISEPAGNTNRQNAVNITQAYFDRLGITSVPQEFLKSLEDGRIVWRDSKGEYVLRRSNYPPFQLYKEVLKGKDPSPKREQFIDLLSKLLRLDPKDRLTAEEALDHPFFSSEVSFRPKITGDLSKHVRILDREKNILATIDPVKCVASTCIHIPKSEQSYTVEVFDPESPEEILSSQQLDISDRSFLTIDIPEWDVEPKAKKPRIERSGE